MSAQPVEEGPLATKVVTLTSDPKPTLPIFSHIRGLLDEVFSLAPPVVQELEVAAITYGAILFQLHLTQTQIAQDAAIGLAIYTAGKTITKALEVLADAWKAARTPAAG